MINPAKFRLVYQTVMKQSQASDVDVYDIIVNYATVPASEQDGPASEAQKLKGYISFERLNILIEAFQYYPLIVKKDKNMSASIHQVLNSTKSAEVSVRLLY
jgi:hypothetical protein